MSILLALFLSPSYSSGTAPFCLMDNFGNTQCYYYTLDACYMAMGSTVGQVCVHR